VVTVIATEKSQMHLSGVKSKHRFAYNNKPVKKTLARDKS